MVRRRGRKRAVGTRAPISLSGSISAGHWISQTQEHGWSRTPFAGFFFAAPALISNCAPVLT